MADMLSHQMIGVVIGTDKARRRLLSQSKSATVCDKALYSAFIDDLETDVCFLANQDIRSLPRKIE